MTCVLTWALFTLHHTCPTQCQLCMPPGEIALEKPKRRWVSVVGILRKESDARWWVVLVSLCCLHPGSGCRLGGCCSLPTAVSSVLPVKYICFADRMHEWINYWFHRQFVTRKNRTELGLSKISSDKAGWTLRKSLLFPSLAFVGAEHRPRASSGSLPRVSSSQTSPRFVQMLWLSSRQGWNACRSHWTTWWVTVCSCSKVQFCCSGKDSIWQSQQ